MLVDFVEFVECLKNWASHMIHHKKHMYAPRIDVDIAALPLLFEVFGDH